MPEGIPFEKMKALGEDLQTRVGEGVHSKLLHDWIGDDEDRKMFLDGMVFGTIRWNKLRGRPRSGPLFTGVTIHHVAEQYNLRPVPDPYPHPDPIDDVFAYDLPDDAENHRVGFNCREVVGPMSGYTGSNDVFVYPAAVPWESVERPLGLGNPRLGFGCHWQAHEGDGFLILPDYVFD